MPETQDETIARQRNEITELQGQLLEKLRGEAAAASKSPSIDRNQLLDDLEKRVRGRTILLAAGVAAALIVATGYVNLDTLVVNRVLEKTPSQLEPLLKTALKGQQIEIDTLGAGVRELDKKREQLEIARLTAVEKVGAIKQLEEDATKSRDSIADLTQRFSEYLKARETDADEMLAKLEMKKGDATKRVLLFGAEMKATQAAGSLKIQKGTSGDAIAAYQQRRETTDDAAAEALAPFHGGEALEGWIWVSVSEKEGKARVSQLSWEADDKQTPQIFYTDLLTKDRPFYVRHALFLREAPNLKSPRSVPEAITILPKGARVDVTPEQVVSGKYTKKGVGSFWYHWVKVKFSPPKEDAEDDQQDASEPKPPQ